MKLPEENSPLTPLSSKRLDMNLGDKYITTKTKLVVLIDKVKSMFQGPGN